MEIGFEKVGQWALNGNNIDFSLVKHAHNNNILYAFIENNSIMYVGKSTKTLYERMSQYKNPGNTQRTNLRNNAEIKKLLSNGKKVEIYAFVDDGSFHYGPFSVNLSAGLEDSIIKAKQPLWNIMK
ncbi:MAG: GIY-YIG nuclease family protein [Bacteroidales bacterium]|nr:GIY-YIG nuclease family protein [Bacteroidales bacterium]